MREGFIFLIVLTTILVYTDARSSVVSDTIEQRVTGSKNKIQAAVGRNQQLCTLCEEYTALAAGYLRANKTETEIIDILHKTCSRLHSYEQQCLVLVDYYAPLFFMEIAKIQPEEFCTRVNLCEELMSVSLLKGDDTCTLCHNVVNEVLAKLKDPDSQLEIIQMLLKECNKMEHYVKECKRLVFRYGPLILANGEKFLESNDICTSIHACTAKQQHHEGTIPFKPLSDA